MRKKVILFTVLVFSLLCMLAFAVNAQCAHTDNWEIKTGEMGLFESWEAINICPDCNIVVADEFYPAIMQSKGYSYFGDSFVQGYEVDNNAKEKYEMYSGKTFEFGVVAGVNSIVGNTPIDAQGNTTHDKVVAYNLGKEGTEHFEIKVVNVPKDKYDEKIIACAYTVVDGEVVYCDNYGVDKAVCGASLNEIVDLLENNNSIKGLYEFRQLGAEELGLLNGGYWHSNSNQYNTPVTSSTDSKKYSSTRMFTRDELPKGSYIVIGNGWQARPELWVADENGVAKKNSSRPYGNNLSSGKYMIDDMWAKNAEFDYLAFNISTSDGFASSEVTAEGVCSAFQIFVPYDTNVASEPVAKRENISVEGMKLLEWDEKSLMANKYWNCTSGTSINTNSTTGAVYYATKQFTKKDLPVGSVIEINLGWMYRPEYWVNSAKVGTRASCTDVYRILVTEDFWDTESERAFNICQILKGNLNKDNWEEVSSAFKIYIPA